MTTILPGRFVPESGTLHKYPATEQCNLDDTDAEVKVETLADLHALPDPRLCEHCFTEKEQGEIAVEYTIDSKVEIVIEDEDGG